jgi:hemerythrin-like domain-containing protein
MSGPIAGVRFIHTAIDREAADVESRASSLTDADGARRLADKLAFFERVNAYHTKGEEVAIFPRLEEKVKHQAPAYLLDHEEERALFAELKSLLAQLAVGLDGKLDGRLHARLVRQSAALRDSLALHIRKENEILVPLLDAAFTPPEQGVMVGQAVAEIPKEEMPAVLPWLVAWLDPDDRESYLREMMRVMPPPVISAAAGWLAEKLPTSAWSDLKRRIPELPS